MNHAAKIAKLCGRNVLLYTGKIFQNEYRSLATKKQSVTQCRKLIFHEPGDPRKVLKKETYTVDRDPGAGEILLRTLSAAVNPSDINTIEGTYGLKPPMPCVPGNEGVALVEKVGIGVKKLVPGDWVIPRKIFVSTWRSHIIAKEGDYRKIPNDTNFDFATTLCMNPPSAYRMLADYKKLKQGDTVIQNGATSAVGRLVIQLCKHRGINTVNVVRNRSNIEHVKKDLMDLGATAVVTEEEMATSEIFKSGSIKEPKLALNCVGGTSASQLLKRLTPKGVMVTYGAMARKPVTINATQLIFKNISCQGFWLTRWSHLHIGKPEDDEMYNDLISLSKKGVLSPPPVEYIPFDDYLKAIESYYSPDYSKKKCILIFGDPPKPKDQ